MIPRALKIYVQVVVSDSEKSDLQVPAKLESIEELTSAVSNLPVETVISAVGQVQSRPTANVNPGRSRNNRNCSGRSFSACRRYCRTSERLLMNRIAALSTGAVEIAVSRISVLNWASRSLPLSTAATKKLANEVTSSPRHFRKKCSLQWCSYSCSAAVRQELRLRHRSDVVCHI